ncbi:Thiol:disulfide interchange protein DsbA [Buchnera aphidicola (Protaphis terricola)]|uniref:DsbA family protein n=1 Tax=Buchnera aphidicola TaxID=9 RepID=UPI003463CDBD
MKQLLIFLFSILFSYNSLSCEFSNKKEYNIRKKNISDVPEIMNFFSFFCPYCYEIEKNYNIYKLIKKKKNKNINIKTYHVNFLGGKLGKILTKAWIVAEQMGVEDKIIIPIFQGIQETHTIQNVDNIKKIFLKNTSISIKKYNQFWNSFFIKILIQKHNDDIKKAKLNFIPTMLINGKYIIEFSKLEVLFKNNFSKKYIKLINFLLKNK